MPDQRNRTISFETLSNKFTDQSCTTADISLPEMKRSHVVPVYLTNAKAAQHFHTTERKEIVDFSVTYIPHDNSDGKALLPHVKELVDSVLTKDYKPAPATINMLNNGTPEKTITINDCIVKGGEITVDKGEFIRITFYLQGLLSADY
jgi:hypothetical protein